MNTRSVKFRAWHRALGRYYTVPRLSFGDDGSALTVTVEHKRADGFVEAWVVGETIDLEQFTGMLDCTGREIFEGDVITSGEPAYPWFDEGVPNYVGTVEWIYGGWQHVLHCVNPEKSGISNGINSGLDEDGDGGKGFRVIGNAHTYAPVSAPMPGGTP